MIFRLYLLVDTEGISKYPYVAISEGTDRILQIAEDHLKLLDSVDADFLEIDYMPTSRSIEFDIAAFDKAVIEYIHITEYSVLIFFNEYKHIVLNYLSPNNESRKDYDIFDGYPNPRAHKLIDTIYPVAFNIKEQVYSEQ